MQATFGTSEELRRVMNIRRRDKSNVSLDALQSLAKFCKHGSRRRKLEPRAMRRRWFDHTNQLRFGFGQETSQPIGACGAAADEECSCSQGRFKVEGLSAR